jgi:hypothetical protein
MKTWHLVYPVAFAISLPLIYKFLLSSETRMKVCTIARCPRQIGACLQDEECVQMLTCFEECGNTASPRRLEATRRYQHVQFPQAPFICQAGCFDFLNEIGETFVECAGSCIEPDGYSDQCADLKQDQVLNFSQVAPDRLEGVWNKPFTNFWDDWPCQKTVFLPPPMDSSSPPLLNWMEDWPRDPNVWRMDCNWTSLVESSNNYKNFSISEAVFPNQRWNYPGGAAAEPTHKSIARMWGAETHENWYLIHADDLYLLYHVCAYTMAMDHYDAVTLVLTKEDNLSQEQEESIQQKSLDILGEKFGSLVRKEDCTMS